MVFTLPDHHDTQDLDLANFSLVTSRPKTEHPKGTYVVQSKQTYSCTGCPKKMYDSDMMFWGAFRYLSSLTMILGTLIYDTRKSPITTVTSSVSYSAPYSS